MIETIDSSVEPDKMLYSEQNEVGVYNDTPDTEEVAETINMTVAENAIVIAESAKTLWRYYITAEEVRLIALIAELEDVNAMQEIAETILNRVSSDRFEGDTVTEIIYAKGQFHTAGSITDDMTPRDEAVQAVTAVFRDGVSTVGEAVFFAEKTVKPEKIAKGLYLASERGDSNFYGQK